MDAKKCDRCGTYYELPAASDEVAGLPFNGLDLIRSVTDEKDMVDVYKSVDLCPTCCAKISDWLNKN